MKLSKNLIGLFMVIMLVAVTAHSAFATVSINEFASNADSNKEWIELYNSDANNAVSLKGWTLVENGKTHKFADSDSIPKGGYFILEQATSNLALNDDGDFIKLKDSVKDIDSVSYGTEDKTKKLPAPKKGEALARVHDGVVLGGLDRGWDITTEPTKNAANNRLPTASDFTIKLDEDKTYTFKEADFKFADKDADKLVSVKVTKLETKGDLKLDAKDVTLNQVIKVADLSKLTFTPKANANGKAYDSFTFSVKEDGPVGADSKTSYKVTVDVNAINDLPTSKDKVISITEDGKHTFSSADFAFTDADVLDKLVSVKVTKLETKGDLKLDAKDVTLNQVIKVADLSKLTFSPKANANGKAYDSFTFTVNDGKADSKTANKITIDVTSQNDAPTSKDVSKSIVEDNTYQFTGSDFAYTDADGNKQVSMKITSVSSKGTYEFDGKTVTAGQVITKADLDKIILAKKFTFKPGENEESTLKEDKKTYNDYSSLKFTVNDGTVDSKEYTYSIIVTPVNDKPVVKTASDKATVEGVKFTHNIVGSDVDNDDTKLTINEVKSTVDGKSISLISWISAKDLTITGTPDADAKKAKTLKVNVVLTDGKLDSEAKTFDLTVKPAFEILVDTIKVKINDKDAVALKDLAKDDKYKVDFKDEVTVTYNYKNNRASTLLQDIINFLLGKVEVKATSPLDAQNDLYNNNDKAALQAGDTASDTFKFTIDPNTKFNGIDFSVKLEVSGKTSGDKSESFSDEISIPFKIEKKPNNAEITEKVSISDDTITCNKNPEITVKVKNTGKNKLDPEVWVFDTEATFNTKTGKFSTTGELAHLTYTEDFKDPADNKKAASPIEPNKEATLKFPLDLSKVTKTGKLYIYVTDDNFYLGKDSFFLGPQDTVELKKVGDCLNTKAIEDELTIGKNKQNPTQLTLLETDSKGEYKYIVEEKGKASKLEFSILKDSKDKDGKDILGQSNSDLIKCSINPVINPGDKQVLTCQNLALNKDGTSDLAVVLNNKLTATAKEFQEKVTVKVTESLKFTALTFNGKSAEVADKGITVKPLESLNVLFKVKNFNANEVKDLDISFVGGDLGLFKVNKDKNLPPNLIAGAETDSLTLEMEVPLGTAEKIYNFEVLLSAKSLDEKTTYTEKVSFRLNVASNPAEILLDAKLSDKKFAEVTCDNTIKLSISATNPSATVNHEVAFTVKDGSTVIYDSLKKDGNPKEKLDKNLLWSIPKTKKVEKTIDVKVSGSEGKHALTVDMFFNHNADATKASHKTSSKTIEVSKKKCLGDKFTPTGSSITLQDGKKQSFSLEVVEVGFDYNKVSWEVTAKDKKGKYQVVGNPGKGQKFEYSFISSGDYKVKATINADNSESKTWIVTVTDKPVDLADFGIKTLATPNKVKDLVISKNDLTIKYSEETDLSDVAKLADVVTLTKVDADKRIVAVDSANAAGLNKKATITVNNFPSGKVHVYRYTGFGDKVDANSKVDCETAAECTKPVFKDGTVTFDVTGFSQFEIINEKGAKLDSSVTEVLSTKNAGETDKLTFSLKNTGTLDKVTGIKLDTSSFTAEQIAKYAFKVSGTPTELDALKSATITVDLTIPKDEDAGSKISLGDLKFTSDKGDVTVSVAIKPVSALSVDLADIEINGKSSGDLSIEDENEIEVTVLNGLTEDLERVSILVEILDVDGEDLEEETDDFDLDAGEDEKETLKFDLSSEDITEETYTVQVTVEGRTDDGTKHKTVVKKEVDVDIEKHKLIFDKASLSTEELSCSRFTTLSLGVKNIGTSDEDDIEIHVTSPELGITGKRTGIDLDDFSGSDNEYDTSFGLDLTNAPKGTYPIKLEVFRDNDKLEESKTVTVTVKDCEALVKKEAEQKQQVATNNALAEQMQAQLQAQMLAQQQQVQKQNNVQGNFRESDNYVMLLGVLIVLVFIALVLAVAVMVLKKK